MELLLFGELAWVEEVVGIGRGLVEEDGSDAICDLSLPWSL